MKARQNKEVGVFVNAMRDGAYIKVKDVDFGKEGASRVTARAVLRTTVTDIASGQVISESESYYDDEYLFTYE